MEPAHSNIPTLTTEDQYVVNGVLQSGVTLPGSPAFYSYKNDNRSWEILDNVIWTRGQHLITVGGGVLLRSSTGYQTTGADGQYLFPNILQFALGNPSDLEAAVDRTTLPSVQQPNFNRTYKYSQDYLFAQDTYKLTQRLTVNYGVRYEFYGGPNNTGSTKDALVQLGSGTGLAQQLVGASLVQPSNSGNQQLFQSSNDLEVRLGAAYDLFGTGRTLLRGAFGTFYDRPFDNLWENVRNNNIILPVIPLPPGPTNFLAPISSVLATVQGQTLASTFPDLTLVDSDLRNGRVKSYFAGVQQRITENLMLEVNALGAYGRALITTDVINRSFSTPDGPL